MLWIYSYKIVISIDKSNCRKKYLRRIKGNKTLSVTHSHKQKQKENMRSLGRQPQNDTNFVTVILWNGQWLLRSTVTALINTRG